MYKVLQTFASPLGHSTVSLSIYNDTHLKCKEDTPKGWCIRADDGTRTRDPNLGKVMRYQLRYIRMHTVLKNNALFCVRDTGIEPVTSSVSGKRSPAELNARALFKYEAHDRDQCS